MIRSALIAGLAFVTLTFAPAAARAELTSCSDITFVPALARETLFPSTPAFAVRITSEGATVPGIAFDATSADKDVTFRREQDPYDPAATLFFPSRPLTTGAETLVVSETCAQGHFDVSQRFIVGADDAPLPTVLGRASIDGDAPNAVLDVAFSSAAAPYGSLIAYELEVDGVVAERFAYGRSIPIEGHARFDLSASEWTGVADVCPGRTDTSTRHVTLRSHIPGATSDPTPIEVDAAVSCASAPTGNACASSAMHPQGGAVAALALGVLALVGARRRRGKRSVSAPALTSG